MTSADVSQGNEVELFSDGAETFDAMIAMIDGANESVTLESYILKADEVGTRFADALARAAKRGVHTRLLADWFGMRGIRSSYLRSLRARRDVQCRNPEGIEHLDHHAVPRSVRRYDERMPRIPNQSARSRVCTPRFAARMSRRRSGRRPCPP